MFGLFGIIAKRISDQLADYAATQADIARRATAEWQEAMTVLQPIRIESASAREKRLRRVKAASRRC